MEGDLTLHSRGLDPNQTFTERVGSLILSAGNVFCSLYDSHLDHPVWASILDSTGGYIVQPGVPLDGPDPGKGGSKSNNRHP